MQVGEMRMGEGVCHIGMEKPQRLETGVFLSNGILANMHKGFGFLEYGCGVWVTRWELIACCLSFCSRLYWPIHSLCTIIMTLFS